MRDVAKRQGDDVNRHGRHSVDTINGTWDGWDTAEGMGYARGRDTERTTDALGATNGTQAVAVQGSTVGPPRVAGNTKHGHITHETAI